jgi:hypothetical protein
MKETWRDDLTEAARLVPSVAAKIADPEIKATLLTTAKVIDTHIRKAQAQMDELIVDPVSLCGKFDTSLTSPR